jgi:iron complex outermembrane receptor protein
MDRFSVTADIDSYHQETSSMATKLPMDVKEIASSLSIMNAAAIVDRNAVTLNDVFSYVVGATQVQGNINGFTFRGFSNAGSYTQNIQFDGLMGATLKKAATSAADVERLEFLKGPNSVLYGQMNPGGLLNIVTQSPEEIRRESVRVTFGTFAGKFNAPGNKNTETISVNSTGPVGHSRRLFYRMVVDFESSPNSRPGNWDQALSYYPSVTYKWSPETYVTVKGEVAQDFRRQDDGLVPIFVSPAIAANVGGVTTLTAAYGPTASFITAPYTTVYQNNSDKATDRGSSLSTFFHTVLGQGWTIRFQSRSVWHQDAVRELTTNSNTDYTPKATYATPTTKLIRQFNYVKNGHRYNYTDANLFRAFDTGFIGQTVIIGIGAGKEFFSTNALSTGPNEPVANALTLINPILNQLAYPGDGTKYSNRIVTQTALGEYISDQIVLAKRLHVSLGLRHDHQKVSGYDKANPVLTNFANSLDTYTRQVGLLYDITQNVAPYVSWSQSVKPQTAIAFDSSGNGAFPPESGEQYEGGLKFENNTKTLNVTVARYEINRTNVLVSSGTNFLVNTGSALAGQAIFRLDGQQVSKGTEIEAQWQPLPNWQVQAGFANSKATIASSVKNPQTAGFDLANAPRNSGNFWTRYNFPSAALKGLGFGTGVTYLGKMWTGDPTTTVYYQVPSWTRVDSSIYFKWKSSDLALNVQNLLDRHYIGYAQSALNLIPGEQRKITLSATQRF